MFPHTHTYLHTYTHTVPTIIDMLADADNIFHGISASLYAHQNKQCSLRWAPAHKSSRTQSITIVHVNWLLSGRIVCQPFQIWMRVEPISRYKAHRSINSSANKYSIFIAYIACRSPLLLFRSALYAFRRYAVALSLCSSVPSILVWPVVSADDFRTFQLMTKNVHIFLFAPTRLCLFIAFHCIHVAGVGRTCCQLLTNSIFWLKRVTHHLFTFIGRQKRSCATNVSAFLFLSASGRSFSRFYLAAKSFLLDSYPVSGPAAIDSYS